MESMFMTFGSFLKIWKSVFFAVVQINQNLHTDLRIEILRRPRSARPHLNYRVWSSDILNFLEGYNNNNNNNNNHNNHGFVSQDPSWEAISYL